MSFADDILVFTDGTIESVNGVIEVLKEFADMSTLHINASKSQIFVAGSDHTGMITEAESLGIGVGNLPIRYLGMPLTTKSLTAHDYEH